MTDNEIIKALECCSIIPANCKQCPLDAIGTADCFHLVIQKNALSLIRRQKAEIDRLKGMVSQNEGVLPEYEKLIKHDIKEIPAADVVEVVRCKDCKRWMINTGIADSPNGHCFEHGICTNGHDFCSYGERKEATP